VGPSSTCDTVGSRIFDQGILNDRLFTGGPFTTTPAPTPTLALAYAPPLVFGPAPTQPPYLWWTRPVAMVGPCSSGRAVEKPTSTLHSVTLAERNHLTRERETLRRLLFDQFPQAPQDVPFTVLVADKFLAECRHADGERAVLFRQRNTSEEDGTRLGRDGEVGVQSKRSRQVEERTSNRGPGIVVSRRPSGVAYMAPRVIA
jgi:hypothetical protein